MKNYPRCFTGFALFAIVGMISTIAQAHWKFTTHWEQSIHTISVNYRRSAGEIDGIYRDYCGGATLSANPEKIRPFLEKIDASLLRIWLLRPPNFFTGTTLEDAQDPEKYNFTEMDRLATAADAMGLELFPTLAITPNSLSGDAGMRGPPRDLAVYAEVIRRVVLHLTQGWANGFHYDIRYWDVWNEPNLTELPSNNHWHGTQQEYFALYKAVSRAIKSIKPLPGRPAYKVGGPAIDGLGWAEPFLRYCTENELPLDFFSFHWYNDDPEELESIILQASDILQRFRRYRHTELVMNEWNLRPNFRLMKPGRPRVENVVKMLGDPRFFAPEAAIHFARSLILMERSPLARGGHFHLADNGLSQMGVFTCPDINFPPTPTGVRAGSKDDPCRPKMKFHVLRLFKMLGETPHLFELQADGGTLDALAGTSEEKDQIGVLIVNWADHEERVGLALENTPLTSRPYRWTQYMLDTAKGEEADPLRKVTEQTSRGEQFRRVFTAPPQSLLFVQLTASE